MPAKRSASRRSLGSDLKKVDAAHIKRAHYRELPALTEEMIARGEIRRAGRPRASRVGARPAGPQLSICPPSTAIVCPVTQLARSLARNSATVATSSGRPSRPEGIEARIPLYSVGLCCFA